MCKRSFIPGCREKEGMTNTGITLAIDKRHELKYDWEHIFFDEMLRLII